MDAPEPTAGHHSDTARTAVQDGHPGLACWTARADTKADGHRDRPHGRTRSSGRLQSPSVRVGRGVRMTNDSVRPGRRSGCPSGVRPSRAGRRSVTVRARHPAPCARPPGCCAAGAPGVLVPAPLRPVVLVTERLGTFLGPWGRRLAPGVIALLAASRPAPSVGVVGLALLPGLRQPHAGAGRASHPDHDLASGVSLLQVPDRLGGLTQRVGPVDDRRDLAGLDELLQHQQVLAPFLRGQRAQRLAREQ